MESEQRHHQKAGFPLLVVEGNKDHQLLIGYCLRAKIPQAEPIFASTVQETTSFLELAFVHQKTFPRLVLLDFYLPDLTDGLKLLNQLRTRYPLLPIIILSSQPEQGLVNKAYQLGANSFLGKPKSLEEWEHLFQSLREYWFNTVTLSNYSLITSGEG